LLVNGTQKVINTFRITLIIVILVVPSFSTIYFISVHETKNETNYINAKEKIFSDTIGVNTKKKSFETSTYNVKMPISKVYYNSTPVNNCGVYLLSNHFSAIISGTTTNGQITFTFGTTLTETEFYILIRRTEYSETIPLLLYRTPNSYNFQNDSIISIDPYSSEHSVITINTSLYAHIHLMYQQPADGGYLQYHLMHSRVDVVTNKNINMSLFFLIEDLNSNYYIIQETLNTSVSHIFNVNNDYINSIPWGYSTVIRGYMSQYGDGIRARISVHYGGWASCTFETYNLDYLPLTIHVDKRASDVQLNGIVVAENFSSYNVIRYYRYRQDVSLEKSNQIYVHGNLSVDLYADQSENIIEFSPQISDSYGNIITSINEYDLSNDSLYTIPWEAYIYDGQNVLLKHILDNSFVVSHYMNILDLLKNLSTTQIKITVNVEAYPSVQLQNTTFLNIKRIWLPISESSILLLSAQDGRIYINEKGTSIGYLDIKLNISYLDENYRQQIFNVSVGNLLKSMNITSLFMNSSTIDLPITLPSNYQARLYFVSDHVNYTRIELYSQGSLNIVSYNVQIDYYLYNSQLNSEIIVYNMDDLAIWNVTYGYSMYFYLKDALEKHITVSNVTESLSRITITVTPFEFSDCIFTLILGAENNTVDLYEKLYLFLSQKEEETSYAISEAYQIFHTSAIDYVAPEIAVYFDEVLNVFMDTVTRSKQLYSQSLMSDAFEMLYTAFLNFQNDFISLRDLLNEEFLKHYNSIPESNDIIPIGIYFDLNLSAINFTEVITVDLIKKICDTLLSINYPYLILNSSEVIDYMNRYPTGILIIPNIWIYNKIIDISGDVSQASTTLEQWIYNGGNLIIIGAASLSMLATNHGSVAYSVKEFISNIFNITSTANLVWDNPITLSPTSYLDDIKINISNIQSNYAINIDLLAQENLTIWPFAEGQVSGNRYGDPIAVRFNSNTSGIVTFSFLRVLSTSDNNLIKLFITNLLKYFEPIRGRIKIFDDKYNIMNTFYYSTVNALDKIQLSKVKLIELNYTGSLLTIINGMMQFNNYIDGKRHALFGMITYIDTLKSEISASINFTDISMNLTMLNMLEELLSNVTEDESLFVNTSIIDIYSSFIEVTDALMKDFQLNLGDQLSVITVCNQSLTRIIVSFPGFIYNESAIQNLLDQLSQSVSRYIIYMENLSIYSAILELQRILNIYRNITQFLQIISLEKLYLASTYVYNLIQEAPEYFNESIINKVINNQFNKISQLNISELETSLDNIFIAINSTIYVIIYSIDEILVDVNNLVNLLNSVKSKFQGSNSSYRIEEVNFIFELNKARDELVAGYFKEGLESLNTSIMSFYEYILAEKAAIIELAREVKNYILATFSNTDYNLTGLYYTLSMAEYYSEQAVDYAKVKHYKESIHYLSLSVSSLNYVIEQINRGSIPTLQSSGSLSEILGTWIEYTLAFWPYILAMFLVMTVVSVKLFGRRVEKPLLIEEIQPKIRRKRYFAKSKTVRAHCPAYKYIQGVHLCTAPLEPIIITENISNSICTSKDHWPKCYNTLRGVHIYETDRTNICPLMRLEKRGLGYRAICSYNNRSILPDYVTLVCNQHPVWSRCPYYREYMKEKERAVTVPVAKETIPTVEKEIPVKPKRAEPLPEIMCPYLEIVNSKYFCKIIGKELEKIELKLLCTTSNYKNCRYFKVGGKTV